MSDELPEEQITGKDLLEQARKVIPTFLERADKPERGGALVAYRANTAKAVSEAAKEYLADNYAAASGQDVTLIDYWPKIELFLTPDMLYEHSTLSLEQPKIAPSSWSYDQKTAVFKAYMG